MAVGQLFTQVKYIGEWHNNKANGHGFGIYRNGVWWAGESKNGNRTGWCVTRYNSGNIYAGQTKEGRRHGKGLYVRANGTVFKSTEWRNGEGL